MEYLSFCEKELTPEIKEKSLKEVKKSVNSVICAICLKQEIMLSSLMGNLRLRLCL